MPVMNGFDAGARLKNALPATKIVVVTVSEDPQLANVATRSWASAFLLKKSAGAELILAVKEVLRNKLYIASGLKEKLTEEFMRHPNPIAKRSLTPRQREVLQLLAEGQAMKQVAAALNVTPRTVAFHKYKIMDEFGLK